MVVKEQACARCGAFVGSDGRTLQGRAYCLVCADRPDVNYLVAFRREYEGKRDALAWLALLAGLNNFGLMFRVGHGAVALAVFAMGVLEIAFFAGQRWSRWGLLPVQIALAACNIAMADGPVEGGRATGRAIAALFFTTMALFNTRNRLFFRLPVSDEALARAWNVYENNSPARLGFALGVVSLVVWPFAAISLPLSLVGLSRVNPSAVPPIGRRWQAIAGIVCSLVGLLVMAGAFIYLKTVGGR
jgi:hypothetical protein